MFSGRGVGQQVYFGDNLKILRDHIATELIDLVHRDRQFNSMDYL